MRAQGDGQQCLGKEILEDSLQDGPPKNGKCMKIIENMLRFPKIMMEEPVEKRRNHVQKILAARKWRQNPSFDWETMENASVFAICHVELPGPTT